MRGLERNISLYLSGEEKRFLVKILDRIQKNLRESSFFQAEADFLKKISEQINEQWNEALPSKTVNRETYISNLRTALNDLKNRKLGSIVDISRDGDPVYITYRNDKGYKLCINTEKVLETPDQKSILTMFSALTVGVVQ